MDVEKSHHADKFYFLMRVKQFFFYLKENPRADQDKVENFRQQSQLNYKTQRAQIKYLQEKNILPYLDVDSNVLLDCTHDTILTKVK